MARTPARSGDVFAGTILQSAGDLTINGAVGYTNGGTVTGGSYYGGATALAGNVTVAGAIAMNTPPG